MLDKHNLTNFTDLPQLLLDFTEIYIQDHKLGKHYFNGLAGQNKYGFQCSASSLSGLN